MLLGSRPTIIYNKFEQIYVARQLVKEYRVQLKMYG